MGRMVTPVRKFSKFFLVLFTVLAVLNAKLQLGKRYLRYVTVLCSGFLKLVVEV